MKRTSFDLIHRSAWLSLFLAGGLFTAGHAAESAPSELKVSHPQRGEIIRYVTLPGTVRPYQQATLFAKVSGYLKKINVDKGDVVKKGALLAEIDVPELESDYRRYEAEMAKWQAEITVAELDLKRLEEARTKAPDLVVPLTVDTASARVLKAKAELGISTANRDHTQVLFNFSRITAPFDGIVTARMVDLGAFIPAASTGSTTQNAALLTVMDIHRVRVQVSVPELESSLLKDGEPVKLSAEGLPGRTFSGEVTRFSHALDEATRTMLAEAEIPNMDGNLRPGMYVTIRVGVERHADALLIPVEALVMEKTAAFVFTESGGKAKKTPVQIDFNDGAKVEVTRGLDATARIILAGKATLNDGQPVKVVEVP